MKKHKKFRKILLIIIIVEWAITFLVAQLNQRTQLNLQAQTWIGNALGLLVLLLPIWLLLLTIILDTDINPTKRLIAKIAFAFLVVCFIGGSITELIEK